MSITRNVSPVPYNQDYKNLAFYIWYQNGRPAMTKLFYLLEPREDGTQPSHITLGYWKRENGWAEKADKMDKEAAIQIQEKLIDDRVKMFEEHAKIGKELREISISELNEYLEDDSFTPNESMRLLQLAVDMERESIGLSDILSRVKDMGDGELQDKIANLMKKGRLTDFEELEPGDNDESSNTDE